MIRKAVKLAAKLSGSFGDPGSIAGGEGGSSAEAKREPAPAIPEVVSAPTRKDDRLGAKALSDGWDIPEEIKRALMARQCKIALDAKSSDRDSTRAFRAIRDALRRDGSAAIGIEVSETRSRVVVMLPDNGRGG